MTAKTKSVKKVVGGTVTSEVKVVDSGAVLLDKSNCVRREMELDSPYIGSVYVCADMKVSKNFQSTGISIGVTLPWVLPPGDVEAVNKAFEFARAVVDAQIEAEATEIRNSFLGG